MNNKLKLYESCQSDHQPNKRQKPNECDVQLIESKKITDLNDDCLVVIFKQLTLRELYNTAISNGLFVEAARLAYRRKFGANVVDVSCVRAHPRRFYFDAFVHSRYQISITNLKSFLQFVRCFGQSMTELKIHCNEQTETNMEWSGYIDQYVNKYCANSLVNISYFNKGTFSTENFKNPFINVESLQLVHSHLDCNSQSFAEWFPNLRRLQLHYNHIGRRFTSTSFQRLEHLTIWISGPNVSNQNIAELLRMHPRLLSLDISFPPFEKMSLTKLTDIVATNHSIEKFVVNGSEDSDLYSDEHSNADTAEWIRFTDEHPTLVELNVRRFQISVGDIRILIGQLKSLKKLYFARAKGINTPDDLTRQLGHGWQSNHLLFVRLERND